jgi:hypothetical protein
MTYTSDSSELENPYAPTSTLKPTKVSEAAKDRVFKFGKAVFVWSAVCSVSAAPSFVIALGTVGSQNWPWMVLGILIFIVGYVASDRYTYNWQFRRRLAVRLSLFITYLIRILASVVFPVALYADMFCGMISSLVVSAFGHEPGRSQDMPGPVVLIWTLSQGIVMNGVLCMIWVMLLTICWFVTNEPLEEELPD